MTIETFSPEAIRTRLSEIAGPEGVLSGEAAAAYSTMGKNPVAVVFLANEGQAAEIAGFADAQGISITPWGGGTKQDVEPVQPTEGIVMVTTGLTALDVDVANLTVSVGAGMVVDELQKELAKYKLFLPMDPTDSARSTIGGMLAANTSGPNRLLYRTARDIVLGLRVVTPFGTAMKVGGKTVKDVAGYDMKKLYIGSWGTLGAITEGTFRLLPLPEARATVAMVFPSLSDACATVSDLLSSFMVPSAADILSPGAMGQPIDLDPGEYLLLVQLEGAVEAVDRQKREMAELAGRNAVKGTTILEGVEEQMLWRRRKGVFAELPADRPAMMVKGSVLLKRVQDYLSGVAALQGVSTSFACHAGNGIAYARVTAEPGRPGDLVRAAEGLQQLARDCGGFALVQKAPREAVGKIRLWPPRDDYRLMQDLKRQLDPNNLWNPARIPGGSF